MSPTIRERMQALGIDNGPNGVDDDVRELLRRVESLLEVAENNSRMGRGSVIAGVLRGILRVGLVRGFE